MATCDTAMSAFSPIPEVLGAGVFQAGSKSCGAQSALQTFLGQAVGPLGRTASCSIWIRADILVVQSELRD